MILRREVTDVVLTRLRAVWAATGDHDAPPDTSGPYAILETPSGSALTGGILCSEHDLLMVVRVRTVGQTFADAGSDTGGERDVTIEFARREAQHLADRLRAALLDRTVQLQTAGWRVAGREHFADAGTEVDVEAGIVNVVDDYRLYVTPR